RTSLREALRFLQVQGLIAMRPSAGVFVGHATAADLAHIIRLYFHIHGATYEELAEGFLLTAPLLAELAAKNSDRQAVGNAMAPFLIEGPRRIGLVKRASVASFYEAIAALTNNRVLVLALGAISALLLPLVSTLDHNAFEGQREIAKAIDSGQETLAR